MEVGVDRHEDHDGEHGGQRDRERGEAQPFAAAQRTTTEQSPHEQARRIGRPRESTVELAPRGQCDGQRR